MLLFDGNAKILTGPHRYSQISWEFSVIPRQEVRTLNFLARLEETSLSLLLRESGLAFFSSLTLHSLAMAFVVGINLALAMRLLGLMPGLELARLRPYFSLHWWATGMIVLSGIALLLAYPAKALTNPVFYLKLVALSTGLLLTAHLQRSIALPDQAKQQRKLGLMMSACWLVTIFAGRFLAYTNSILLASSFY